MLWKNGELTKPLVRTKHGLPRRNARSNFSVPLPIDERELRRAPRIDEIAEREIRKRLEWWSKLRKERQKE